MLAFGGFLLGVVVDCVLWVVLLLSLVDYAGL